MVGNRAVARGCLIALGVVAAVLVLLGAGCALAVSSLNNLDFGLGHPRKHLAPIPVSLKVCPYVRVMHAAANDFQRVNPIATLIFTGSKASSRAWPAERARIEQRLNVLGFTVAASRSQFPEPIQRRLDIVLANIRSGGQALAEATNASDATGRTLGIFATGQTAFGEASDLVGNACGVHLAADSLAA